MYLAFQYVRRAACDAVLPRIPLGCCAARALYVPFASAVPLLAGEERFNGGGKREGDTSPRRFVAVATPALAPGRSIG
jgi:hypothetical protein